MPFILSNNIQVWDEMYISREFYKQPTYNVHKVYPIVVEKFSSQYICI